MSSSISTAEPLDLAEVRRLFNASNAPIGLYIKDVDGVYLWCNINFALIMGYLSEDKIIGKTDGEITTQGLVRGDVCENDRKALETDEVLFSHEHGFRGSISHSRDFVQQRRRAITSDGRKVIVGTCMEAPLIVDQARMLREQVTDGQALINVLNLMTDCYVQWVDAGGVILKVNETYAAMFGLSPQDLVGKKLSDISGGHDLEAIMSNNKLVMETNASHVFIERLVIDGQEKFVKSCKAPLRDEYGHVFGVGGLSMLVDSTAAAAQSVKEEQALCAARIDKIKGLFAEVLHDVRTNLSTIILYASEVARDPDDYSKEDLLDELESVDYLAQESNHFIKTGLIQSTFSISYSELYLSTWDFAEMIQETINGYKASILEATLHVSPGVNTTFMFDRPRFSRLFKNFLSNAVKYKRDSQSFAVVNIYIEHYKGEKGGEAKHNMIMVRVEDKGMGILSLNLDNVFKMFHKSVHNPTPSRTGETKKRNPENVQRHVDSVGLGLAIGRQVVRAHGGEMRVENNAPAHGCTFFLTVMTDLKAPGKNSYSIFTHPQSPIFC